MLMMQHNIHIFIVINYEKYVKPNTDGTCKRNIADKISSHFVVNFITLRRTKTYITQNIKVIEIYNLHIWNLQKIPVRIGK